MGRREVSFWLLQLITAAVIFFLLGIHLVWLSIWRKPIEWEGMIERATNGWWLVFYIILLAAVLYHGLYGLRVILLEIWSSPESGRKVTVAVAALGVVAFVFGTYVPIKLFAS